MYAKRPLSLFAVSVISLVGIALSLAGCGPSISQTTVSDNIPYEAQQRINTSEEYDASFKFNGIPEGKRIIVDYPVGTAKSAYRINSPLEGKMKRLNELKFGNVTPESKRGVEITIRDITTSTEKISGSAFTGDQVFEHTLGLTISAKITREDSTYEKEISRSTTIQPKIEESRYSYKRIIPEEEIDEFLMQFVVGVSSFIDSNFGIE